jgi:hypothetical protein
VGDVAPGDIIQSRFQSGEIAMDIGNHRKAHGLGFLVLRRQDGMGWRALEGPGGVEGGSWWTDQGFTDSSTNGGRLSNPMHGNDGIPGDIELTFYKHRSFWLKPC